MKINFKTLFLILLLGLPAFSSSYNPEDTALKNEIPQELKNVGLDQKLGKQLDLSLSFRDDLGETVTLGKYFDNNTPVLMAMIYYSCPSLCSYQLNGMLDTFKKMKWTAGQDFKIVAVSMNHREKPALAYEKKMNYLEAYGRGTTKDKDIEKGWHFLTGTEANVKKMADQLGFKFKWIESTQQYSHPAVAYVLTPGGQISRYFNGIQFSQETLRLSLIEASSGKIGSIIDQILLFCFQFDPNKNKYTIAAYNIMKIGGALMIFVLGLILIPLWMRETPRAGSV